MRQYAALIYEQWRSMRMLFAIAIAFSFVPGMVVYLLMLGYDMTRTSDYDTFQFFTIYGLLIAHFFWLCILLAAPGDDGDLKITMPRFLMRLPVSAWKLAAARLSFGVGSSCMLTLAGASLHYALYDASMVEAFPFFYSLLVGYATAYVVFQAVTWWVGPAGFVPTIVVIIAVVVGIPRISNDVFYYFGFDHYFQFDNFFQFKHIVEDQYAALGIAIAAIMSFLVGFDLYANFDPADKYQYAALGIAVTLTISFLAGVAAIAQHRKSRFLGLKVLPSLGLREGARRSRVTETFSSKAEALRWFQYRQQSRLYPRVLFFFSIGSFAFILRFIGAPPEAMLAMYASSVLIAISAAIYFGTLFSGIYFLFRGWRPFFKNDRIFLFVRPATTMDLITARWESNVKAAVFGMAPLLGIAAVASFTFFLQDQRNIDAGGQSAFGQFASQQPAYVVLFMGAAAIVYIFAAVWAILWLENVLALCIVGGMVELAMAGYSALQETEPDNLETYGFGTVGAVALVLLLILIAANWRNKLVSVKHLLFALGLTPIVAAGFVVVTNAQKNLFQETVDGSYPETLTTMSPLIMLAILAPIITGPAIMQWARHRR